MNMIAAQLFAVVVMLQHVLHAKPGCKKFTHQSTESN